ncbi:MAG: hypothetical protein ABH862_02340 [Candidatus Omnitrophota bacterium]
MRLPRRSAPRNDEEDESAPRNDEEDESAPRNDEEDESAPRNDGEDESAPSPFAKASEDRRNDGDYCHCEGPKAPRQSPAPRFSLLVTGYW